MTLIDTALDTAFGTDSPEGMRDNLEPMVRQLFLMVQMSYGDNATLEVAEQLDVLRSHCLRGEFDEARALCVTNGASPQMIDLMMESMRPYFNA